MTMPRRTYVPLLGGALAAFLWVGSAVPQGAADRLVSLVVASGAGVERAEEVLQVLDQLGAETLRGIEPSNAELRSLMRRFATEARDARTAIVYVDMPAVVLDERAYVAPDLSVFEQVPGQPDRPTDVFIHAIPLQAFARVAAQAGVQGTVFVASQDTGAPLVAPLTPMTAAPEAVPGAAPISVFDAANTDLVRDAMLAFAPEVNIPEMLDRMSVIDGVSVSFVPEPLVPEVAPAPIEDTNEPLQETLEELALLEKSLSRAAKRSIQRGLRESGHYNGLADGVIGPQSRDAIKAFQAKRDEPATGFLTRRQLLDLTQRS